MTKKQYIEAPAIEVVGTRLEAVLYNASFDDTALPPVEEDDEGPKSNDDALGRRGYTVWEEEDEEEENY